MKGEKASTGAGRRRTSDGCSDEQFYVLLRTQERHTLSSKVAGVRRVWGQERLIIFGPMKARWVAIYGKRA